MRSYLSPLRKARVWVPLGAFFTVVGLGLIACISPPLESPVPVSGRVHPIYIPQNLKNKVDLLFMIDNSNSMDAMQNELKNKFSEFFKPFMDLADQGTFADLNIGVVTSDFGAGATGAPGCTPSGLQGGGDQGKLQGLGRKADGTCNKPKGTNFIHYAFGPNGPSKSNLPGTQGLVQTFTCMASVGSSGCGFEHQLESVYAALHNSIPDNQGSVADPGFIRDDALLVVVFLTNEDDASAPPESDVFDKNKVAQYGYEDSYSRQTRFAVMCGSPPAFPPYCDSSDQSCQINNPLAGCIAAPNPDNVSGPGKQYDIQRYIDFFTRPAINGGAKANPLDVVLIGIDAAETPFQVILSNPGTPAGNPYVACGKLNEQSNPPCVPVLQHSCTGTPATCNDGSDGKPKINCMYGTCSGKTCTGSPFFGDPAVRLNAVIQAVNQHQITSICADDYTPALESAAKLIVSNLGGGCIPDAFPLDSATGKLKFDCVVQDETIEGDGTKTDIGIPRCEDDNPDGMHANVPCWVIAHKDACCLNPMVVGGQTVCDAKGLSPDGVGLTIDRGKDQAGVKNQAPPHTTAIVTCATKST